ncbi:restriction endonuclease [Streptomyces sp. NPDC088788]|uniref:restriction endonuclease n=1 Tax=Streptomyces sp. NPDC088788 TaxID=3365898 RepID=UPI0037F6D324
MHLNWKTGVALPMYHDAGMNLALQRRIQAATDDDLLSAFLHFTEGKVALSAYHDFDLMLFDVRREEDHAAKLDVDGDSPLSSEYIAANHGLKGGLGALAAEVEEVRNEIGSVWHSLREATTDDLNHRYRLEADPAESGLDAIGPLRRRLDPLWDRLIAALAQHTAAMHELALREAEFQAFAVTADSIRPEQFDRMAPLEFELAIASLVQRDGYSVVQRNGGARDLGADVIAITPDGRKIVFQCKHRRPGGRPLGSPVIQTLNGTARPVHGADIVIAVTNSSFTSPAHELAGEQGIHLLFGHDLRRWATWGVSLLTVLGADLAPVGEAA